jgi:hypothetical protein
MVKSSLPDVLLIRFEIVDTGIGIAEEDVPKLFQKFSQLEGSLTRRYGGVGLGLSICKKLTELMGGSIGVTSELKKGSTFWVEVPFRFVAEPALISRSLAGLVVELIGLKEKERLIIEAYLRQWQGALAPEGQGALLITDKEEALHAKKPTIWIVDREKAVPEGVQAKAVTRPISAIELYQALEPHNKARS